MKTMQYVRKDGVIWDYTNTESPIHESFAQSRGINSAPNQGINRAKRKSRQIQMKLDGALGRGSLRRSG